VVTASPSDLKEDSVLSQRAEAAVGVGVSLIMTATYPWLPELGIIGLVLLAFSTLSLVIGLRRSPDDREQERLIRALYTTVRRLRKGRTLQVPETGKQFAVERRRGFLTLVVSGPPSKDATSTRYRISWLGFPSPPPLIGHTTAAGDTSAAKVGWLALTMMTTFNRKTGLLEISTADLAQLRDQLARAAAAGQSHLTGEQD
jgi:hypothetical protein